MLNDLKRQSRVVVKASLIIQLIDSFTGRPPNDPSLIIEVNGITKQPIKKPGGYYVFTDLGHGEHILHVRSRNYLDETKVLKFDEDQDHLNEDIILIILKPSTSYTNQNGLTAIRFSIQELPNYDPDDFIVTAIIKDPKCSVGKIAQDYLAKSSKMVSVVNQKKIAAGDYLMISEKTKGTNEYCYVTEICNDGQAINVNRELEHDYQRGSLLLPVIQTKINHNREAILFFRNYPLTTYDVVLMLKCNEYVIEKDITVKEGEMINLGVIML